MMTKQRQFLHLVWAIAIVSFLLVIQKQTEANASFLDDLGSIFTGTMPGFKLYENVDPKYKIQYPSDWFVNNFTLDSFDKGFIDLSIFPNSTDIMFRSIEFPNLEISANVKVLIQSLDFWVKFFEYNSELNRCSDEDLPPERRPECVKRVGMEWQIFSKADSNFEGYKAVWTKLLEDMRCKNIELESNFTSFQANPAFKLKYQCPVWFDERRSFSDVDTTQITFLKDDDIYIIRYQAIPEMYNKYYETYTKMANSIDLG